MAKHRVLVIDSSIHPDGIDLLRARFSVKVISARAEEGEVVANARGVDAILLRAGNVRAAGIDAATRLRIVARHGSGVDTVDVDAATRRGVVVTNTGAANTTAVAEYAFALILSIARNVTAADASMKAREWGPSYFPAQK